MACMFFSMVNFLSFAPDVCKGIDNECSEALIPQVPVGRCHHDVATQCAIS